MKYVIAISKKTLNEKELTETLKEILDKDTDSFVKKLVNANRYETERYRNEKRKREDEKYDKYDNRSSSEDEYRRSRSPPREKRYRDDYRNSNRGHRFDERRSSRYQREDRRDERRQKRDNEEEYNPEKPLFEKKQNEPNQNLPKRNSDTLGLNNIPNELNTIDKLNGHFKKFGTIVNINVKPENNKAFIQFTSNEEAYKAFSSPEAVLDNRFIKIFWAKPRVKEVPKEVIKETPKEVIIKPTQPIPKKDEKTHEQRVKDYKEIVAKLEKMQDGEEKAELTKKLKMLMEMDQKKEDKKEVALKLEPKPKPVFAPRSSLKIDNRTSTVEIKNIPSDKLNQESIKKHFQKFSIKNITFEGPLCLITFEDRKTAEIAISKAKIMDTIKLEFQFKVEKKEKSDESSQVIEKKPETPVEVEEYQVERRERFDEDDTERSWKR